MSAVVRQPQEPNEEENQRIALALDFALRRAEYEAEARQRRIDLFANATLGVILIGAFVAVGVILSPGFSIF